MDLQYINEMHQVRASVLAILSFRMDEGEIAELEYKIKLLTVASTVSFLTVNRFFQPKKSSSGLSIGLTYYIMLESIVMETGVSNCKDCYSELATVLWVSTYVQQTFPVVSSSASIFQGL